MAWLSITTAHGPIWMRLARMLNHTNSILVTDVNFEYEYEKSKVVNYVFKQHKTPFMLPVSNVPQHYKNEIYIQWHSRQHQIPFPGTTELILACTCLFTWFESYFYHPSNSYMWSFVWNKNCNWLFWSCQILMFKSMFSIYHHPVTPEDLQALQPVSYKIS